MVPRKLLFGRMHRRVFATSYSIRRDKWSMLLRRCEQSSVVSCEPDHIQVIWSEYPNIWEEVQELMYGCDWFKAYDIWDLAFSLSVQQNLSLFLIQFKRDSTEGVGQAYRAPVRLDRQVKRLASCQ